LTPSFAWIPANDFYHNWYHLLVWSHIHTITPSFCLGFLWSTGQNEMAIPTCTATYKLLLFARVINSGHVRYGSIPLIKFFVGLELG